MQSLPLSLRLNSLNLVSRPFLGTLLLLPMPARAAEAVGVAGFNVKQALLWLCITLGLGAFVGLLYWAYRARRQGQSVSKKDLLWAVLPFVLLVALATPALQTLFQQQALAEGTISIRVTGAQWRWRFQYPEASVDYHSDGATQHAALSAWTLQKLAQPSQISPHVALKVPVGVPLQLLFTSEDVLHGWWVEGLGMRTDVIPGFVSELRITIEKPGYYLGSPAGSCVEDNVDMPYALEAVPEPEYRRWLEQYHQRAENAES